jgi:hypothetical protein
VIGLYPVYVFKRREVHVMSIEFKVDEPIRLEGEVIGFD